MTRSTGPMAVVGLLVASGLLLTGAPSASAKDPDPGAGDLAQLLSSAGQYVVEYERLWRGLVADEAYRQMYWDPTRRLSVRNLRSNVVLLKLPGAMPWAALRDVYEVDGKALRERDARLEKLMVDTRPAALEQVRVIVQEGAQHNLSPLIQRLNVPPTALTFLHPKNQERFSFKRKGSCSGADERQAGVEVALTETARPALTRGPDGDVPVTGKLCIEPQSGAVLRTDVEFDLDGRERDRWSWARVLVLYGRDARLGAFVPMEMKETYQFAGIGSAGLMTRDSSTGPGNEIRIEATARYSDFHRLPAPAPEAAPPEAAPPSAAAPQSAPAEAAPPAAPPAPAPATETP